MAIKYSSSFLLLIISISFVAELFATEIYVWRDENGVTVYSDVKRPGAKTISLSEDKVTIMKKADTAVFNKTNTQKKKVQYSVEIMSPSHEETIRDNSGTLHISARIMPSFNPNQKVQLLLDGKIVKPAQQSASFLLSEINRGAHSLQVQLLNDKGQIIASSNLVTVYMHRASAIGRK